MQTKTPVGHKAAAGALLGLIAGLAVRWLWWPEAGIGTVLGAGAIGTVIGLAVGLWMRRAT